MATRSPAGCLDSDSDQDLAAASDFDNKSALLALFVNEGGAFSAQPLLTIGVASLRGIALAELNGDGALGVVLSDQTNAQLFVFFSEP